MLEKVSITDMEGKDQDLATTVLTCEGDIKDPAFPYRLQSLVYKLQRLISNGKRAFWLKKVEPWNSVRVTFSIPREAAQRLRQLAEQGDHVLRDLGILSVQIEGDQVITLTLAGRYSEHQELVLRKSPETTQAVDSQGTTSTSSFDLPGTENLPGPSNVEATRKNIVQYLSQQGTVTVAAGHEPSESIPRRQSVSAASANVGFRSPNVVAPASTDLPFLTTSVSGAGRLTPGGTVRPQTNYGPFPFASMTHAMNTKHASTPHNQQTGATRFPFPHQYSAATSQSSTFTSAFVPQRKTVSSHPTPAPPNVVLSTLSSRIPGTATTVSPAVAVSRANIALSSPLLVNLLQSDAQLHSNKMLPPPAPDLNNPQKRKRKPRKPKDRSPEESLLSSPPFVVPSAIARSMPSSYDPTGFLVGHSSSVILPVTSHIPQVPNIHPQAQGQPKVDTGGLHFAAVGSPPVARIAQMPLHSIPFGSCVAPPQVGVQDTRITSSLLKEADNKPQRPSPESNPFPSSSSPPLSTDGKTKHLINPFTGHLEPMPSDEEEEEESLDSLPLFPDFELDASENGQSERSLSDSGKDNNHSSDTDSGICKSITDLSQSSADLTPSDSRKESPPSVAVDDHCQRTGDGPSNIIQRELKLRLKLDHRSVVKDLEARDKRTKVDAQSVSNPGCKVDVSFVSIPGSGMRKVNAEPKVPPLHISLRGPNAAVVVSPRKDDKQRSSMKDIADHANNIMDVSTKLFDQKKPRSPRNSRLSVDSAPKDLVGKKITYRDFKRSKSFDKSREQKLLSGGNIVHTLEASTTAIHEATSSSCRLIREVYQRRVIVDDDPATPVLVVPNAGSGRNGAEVTSTDEAAWSGSKTQSFAAAGRATPLAKSSVTSYQEPAVLSTTPVVVPCESQPCSVTAEPEVVTKVAAENEGALAKDADAKELMPVSNTIATAVPEHKSAVEEPPVQDLDKPLPNKDTSAEPCTGDKTSSEKEIMEPKVEEAPVSFTAVPVIDVAPKHHETVPINKGNCLSPDFVETPTESNENLARKNEEPLVLAIPDVACVPPPAKSVPLGESTLSQSINHVGAGTYQPIPLWPREFRQMESNEAVVSNRGNSLKPGHRVCSVVQSLNNHSDSMPFENAQNNAEASDMCLFNFSRRNSASSPIAKIISVDSLPLKGPQVLEVPSVCVTNSVPIAAMKAGTSIDTISIPSLIPSDGEVGYCQSVSMEEERYVTASPLKLVTLSMGSEAVRLNHLHTNHTFKRVSCEKAKKVLENGTAASSEESSMDSMDDLSQSPSPTTCRGGVMRNDRRKEEATQGSVNNPVDQNKITNELVQPVDKNNEESLEEKSEKGVAVSPGTSVSEVSNISSLSEPSLLDKLETKEDITSATTPDCYANSAEQLSSSPPDIERCSLPKDEPNPSVEEEVRRTWDGTPDAVESKTTECVVVSVPSDVSSTTTTTTAVTSVGATVLSCNRGVFSTSGETGKVTLIIKSGTGGTHTHSLLSTATTSGGVVVPFNPSKSVPIKLVALPSGTSSLSGRSGNSTLFEIIGQSSSASHTFSSAIPGSASPVRLVVSKMSPVKSAATATQSVSCKTVVVKSVVVTGTSSSIKLVPARGVSPCNDDAGEAGSTPNVNVAAVVEELPAANKAPDERAAETRTSPQLEPPEISEVPENSEQNMQETTPDIVKTGPPEANQSMQTVHIAELSETAAPPLETEPDTAAPTEVDSAISSPAAIEEETDAKEMNNVEISRVGADSTEATVHPTTLSSSTEPIDQRKPDSEPEVVFSKPLKRKCSENAAELIKACMGVEDNPKRVSAARLREEEEDQQQERPRRVKTEDAPRKTGSEAATTESECSSEDEMSLSELASKSRARGVSTRSSQRNNFRDVAQGDDVGRRRSGSGGDLKRSVFRDGKKEALAKCPVVDSRVRKNPAGAREARSGSSLRRNKEPETRTINSSVKDETNEPQLAKRKTRSGGSTDQLDCVVAAPATKRRRVSKDSHR